MAISMNLRSESIAHDVAWKCIPFPESTFIFSLVSRTHPNYLFSKYTKWIEEMSLDPEYRRHPVNWCSNINPILNCLHKRHKSPILAKLSSSQPWLLVISFTSSRFTSIPNVLSPSMNVLSQESLSSWTGIIAPSTDESINFHSIDICTSSSSFFMFASLDSISEWVLELMSSISNCVHGEDSMQGRNVSQNLSSIHISPPDRKDGNNFNKILWKNDVDRHRSNWIWINSKEGKFFQAYIRHYFVSVRCVASTFSIENKKSSKSRSNSRLSNRSDARIFINYLILINNIISSIM